MWAGSVRNGLINIKEVGMKPIKTYCRDRITDWVRKQSYPFIRTMTIKYGSEQTEGASTSSTRPPESFITYFLPGKKRWLPSPAWTKTICWFRYSAKACLSFIKKPTDISRLSLSTTALMIFYAIGENSQCISKYSWNHFDVIRNTL